MKKASNDTILESAHRTIALQASAINGLMAFADESFAKAVQVIARSTGRLVVSGIGKSAIIAQKIVATMNSTGTPALFMHAADAIHGDLGMIGNEDIVLLISKSGDSPEIKVLVPFIKNFGNTLIGMTGNMHSYLAAEADIQLNTTVEREACPNNLAPTTSSTAQMVLGDALAICLMEAKDFRESDFARFHPGGLLGKKLYLRAEDLLKLHEKPQVQAKDDIHAALLEMTQKRLGATVVLDESGDIAGIITDGDIRRMFEKTTDIAGLQAKDIMNKSPKTADVELTAVEVLELMKRNNISQVIITRDNKYAGIIHVHDLLKEGII